MSDRIHYAHHVPEAMKAMVQLEHLLNNGTVEKPLLDLVRTRISQMNGCVYCLDLHARELRQQSHDANIEQKLTLLPAWRDATIYSDRERAALEWAEALTNIQTGHAPDAVYQTTLAAFGEQPMVELTLAITSMNQWNRLGVAFRLRPKAELAS
jgi:AhpD family alkylhydroperoxidase